MFGIDMSQFSEMGKQLTDFMDRVESSLESINERLTAIENKLEIEVNKNVD